MKLITKTIDYLLFLLRRAQLSSQVSDMQRRLKSLRKQKEKSDQELALYKSSLNSLKDQFDDEMKKANRALNEAAGLNKKYEQALEAAQEELKTCKEILIPGLIQSNRVLIDRWDAESAVQAMRKVAASGANQGIE